MKLVWRFFLLILLLGGLLLTACTGNQESNKANLSDEAYQDFLAEQEEEAPTSTPVVYRSDSVQVRGTLEILSYGPIGETDSRAQVRVEFATPLVPLSALDDRTRQEVLQHFKIEPQVPGRFRLLGTSTVVFQPAPELPPATHYRVTVTRGLQDLQGHRLEEDFQWEFSTPLPRLRLYPQNGAHHVKPDLLGRLFSTQELSLDSLQIHFAFYETSSGQAVKFKLWEDREAAEVARRERNRRYIYFFCPRKPLKKDTDYTIEIKPGILTAQGNRPLPEAITSTFRTYPPFRFVRTGFCDHCGANLVTIPYLQFTNYPERENLEAFLQIDPPTERFPFLDYGCDDFSIQLNTHYLLPHTTYRVTIKPGLRDIYGQKISNPQVVTFTTGDLTPELRAPEGFLVVPPTLDPEIVIESANLKKVFATLLPLNPALVLTQSPPEHSYQVATIFRKLQLDSTVLALPRDSLGRGRLKLNLKPYLREGQYGAVAFRFWARPEMCYRTTFSYSGLLVRTNLGLHAQFYPAEGFIKVNRLTDGKPVAGATVKIYRRDDLARDELLPQLFKNQLPGEIHPRYQGTTDARGLIPLSASDLARLAPPPRRPTNRIAPPDPKRPNFYLEEPPILLVVAEKDGDWTYLRTGFHSELESWQFGVMSAWEANRPLPRGTIFSDRQLYRPGDTVRIKGVLRYLQYGRLHKPVGQTFTVTLRGPRGKATRLGQVTLSEFGTFHLDIPTRENQPLGYYQVVAESEEAPLRFFGGFRLAEFRVPEFSVSLNIDQQIALAGEPIRLSWEGKYYFGAPMSGAKVSLNVTRRRTSFQPQGWKTFSFGIPEYLQDQKVSLPGGYLRETLKLDQQGRGEKRLVISREDVPFPMIYRAEVEVEDVSRQTVSASRSVTLLPYSQLVGLQLNNWITSKNKPVTVKLVVTDPQGKPLTGVPVRVKLIKREYHSVKVEAPDGTYRMEHNIVKKETDRGEVESAKEPLEVTLTPREAGSYLILAELRDFPNSGTAAATPLWVAGDDYVPWEERGEDRLQIVLDKKEYRPGDEAVALIQSPFPEAELLVTVSREKVFHREILQVKGSAVTYRFKVTEEMLPNAYFGAVLFRLGKPIVPLKEQEGKHLERIGFVNFRVALDSKYLQVRVAPERTRLRPGDSLRVNLQVTRQDGEAERSELTVMVVDEAVLALTGYTLPDLVKTVYRTRGLSARLFDNRTFVVTEDVLLQKGQGYGGGRMAGAPGLRIRKKFVKLAYYDPALLTDSRGQASFAFKLPDNLTTWRIAVVAVSEQDRFGKGEAKVVVSQPFLLRPILPRFVRLGDTFRGGVAVTNLTRREGKVTVNISLPDCTLVLSELGDVQEGLVLQPGETRAVLFPLEAARAGKAKLEFRATFRGRFQGKEITKGDALEIPLKVEPLTATETVVAVGETDAQATQQIKVDQTVHRDLGGLHIQISATALNHIAEGARYLVDYPYGCLEQTLSRLLTLMELKFLSEKYNFTLQTEQSLAEVIELNRKKILQLQNSDGGFKFWDSSRNSDCYLSPYVAYYIYRNQQLGYSFPENSVKSLIRYLNRALTHPCRKFKSWRPLAEYRLNVLTGLFYLGQPDESYLEEYFNRRQELGTRARLQLAYLLAQTPRWKSAARQMLSEIKNGLFQTAQTAHLESNWQVPSYWRFLDSPVAATAEALKLFLTLEPDSPVIARMVRYLLNARKNGRWRNTYENARAIDALVEVALQREAQNPNFTARVLLAGQEVLKHHFKDFRSRPVETSLPMQDLPPGTNLLEILKTGTGRLYYTLSYRYRLKGLQPARQEGFAIKRTVRRLQGKDLLGRFDTDPMTDIKILAGETVEVELEFLVPQTIYHLVIDDPIPAGLEVLDTSLKTTTKHYSQDIRPISLRNPINHRELRDERVVLIAEQIAAGTYRYKYLLRATSSGRFFWPAATISLMYEPEEFGRCAEGMVEVVE